MLPPGSLSACWYDVTVDGPSWGIDCLEAASPAVLISNDGGNVQGPARNFALRVWILALWAFALRIPQRS